MGPHPRRHRDFGPMRVPDWSHPSRGSHVRRGPFGLCCSPRGRLASVGQRGAAMAGAVVVYESVFGDAEAIARAVAAGLSTHLDVEVVAATDAPREFGADVRLLVVGGPNHAMGMPRPPPREGAVKQHSAETAAPPPGLHEGLEEVRVAGGISAAAFDPRLDHPRFVMRMDHASRTEERLLHKLGATLAAPAEHFFVVDTTGPLAAGEEDRARQWGQAIAEIVTAGTRR